MLLSSLVPIIGGQAYHAPYLVVAFVWIDPLELFENVFGHAYGVVRVCWHPVAVHRHRVDPVDDNPLLCHGLYYSVSARETYSWVAGQCEAKSNVRSFSLYDKEGIRQFVGVHTSLDVKIKVGGVVCVYDLNVPLRELFWGLCLLAEVGANCASEGYNNVPSSFSELLHFLNEGVKGNASSPGRPVVD
ncbi:hypothetical protein ADU37_CDS07480 [Thermococcus sp. 2319x1]|nr:hypothetical protein ADU37_CDS07480 [Thermococcus sp. 2319x1]